MNMKNLEFDSLMEEARNENAYKNVKLKYTTEYVKGTFVDTWDVPAPSSKDDSYHVAQCAVLAAMAASC
jgi:hypothetical protein